jgi:class 3 adenylate cyclase
MFTVVFGVRFQVAVFLSVGIAALYIALWTNESARSSLFYSALLFLGVAEALIACYTDEWQVRSSFVLSWELQSRQKKIEELLFSILPPRICEKVLRDEQILTSFPSATVMFCSIENFHEFVQSNKPGELFDKINLLYSKFDDIVKRFDMFKVEHIESDYVVASRILEAGEYDSSIDTEEYRKKSALTMIYLALALLREGAEHKSIKFKVGISTGPCVGGIIGSSRKFYRLFGDTVNTASRMKHHGKVKCVHMNEATYSLVKDSEFHFEHLQTTVKGKGLMPTYLTHDDMGFSMLANYEARMRQNKKAASISAVSPESVRDSTKFDSGGTSRRAQHTSAEEDALNQKDKEIVNRWISILYFITLYFFPSPNVPLPIYRH